MEMNQQYRLLQQQAGISNFPYNGQTPARPPMLDMPQYPYINRDYEEDGPAMFDSPPAPRSIPRRTKRTIPDGEKDDRYWEKRKRNNEAAKRSRENKRRLDYEIRHRLGSLEEENALMRRELEVLKTKLCIPLDQSVLSADERAEVIAQVEKSVNAKGSPGQDEIDILPAPMMMNATMDLSKRRSMSQIKRDPDESMQFMSYPMNAPLVWQDQQSLSSYSPPNVLKRGPYEAVKPYTVLQSPTFLRQAARASPYDVYQSLASTVHYQQPPSPNLDRLNNSPPSISPVPNLNSSMSGSNLSSSMNGSSSSEMSLMAEQLHEQHRDHTPDQTPLRMKLNELEVAKMKDYTMENLE